MVTKNTVLVVEDDPQLQKYFRELFSEHFPEITLVFCESEKRACDFVRTYFEALDFVLLDGSIVGGFGWSVARILREEKKCDVPIIYCGSTELPKEFVPYMTHICEKHNITPYLHQYLDATSST